MCRILAFSTHSELALQESEPLANVSNTQSIEPIARSRLELNVGQAGLSVDSVVPSVVINLQIEVDRRNLKHRTQTPGWQSFVSAGNVPIPASQGGGEAAIQ